MYPLQINIKPHYIEVKLPFGVIFDLVAITKIAILAVKSKTAAWILSKFTSTPLSQGQVTFFSHFWLVAITKMVIDYIFSLLMNLLMPNLSCPDLCPTMFPLLVQQTLCESTLNNSPPWRNPMLAVRSCFNRV